MKKAELMQFFEDNEINNDVDVNMEVLIKDTIYSFGISEIEIRGTIERDGNKELVKTISNDQTKFEFKSPTGKIVYFINKCF